MKDIRRALKSCSNIVDDLPDDPSKEDIQGIINAANQAAQVVADLRMLEGFIRGTS
jgi:hypothetical protein